MKKYVFLALLLILPIYANAAWWNPSTWFEQDQSAMQEIIRLNGVVNIQAQEIDRLKSLPTPSPVIQEKIVTQKDTSQQGTIDTLNKKIVDLQSQYAMCQTKMGSISVTPTPAVKPINSDAVKKIAIELAYLDKLDFYIDNAPVTTKPPYNTNVSMVTGGIGLIDILNDTKRLDGKDLFPNAGVYVVALGPKISPDISNSLLHQYVNQYRIELQNQIKIAGEVDYTSSI